MKRFRNIHNLKLLALMSLSLLGLLFIVTCVSPSYASIGGNNISATLTPNQIAAGGPISPNYTMALQEAKCAPVQENVPLIVYLFLNRKFHI